MRVEVVQAFKWSPNGYDVIEVPVGVRDVPDGAAAEGIKEGWARLADASPAPAPPKPVGPPLEDMTEGTIPPRRRARR